MHYAPFEMWAASVSWRTWKEQQGGMGNMHVMQTGGRQKRKVRYAQQKRGGMEREMQPICRAKKGERKGWKYAKVTNATTRDGGMEGGASDRSLS